jgi:hypothetical protein
LRSHQRDCMDGWDQVYPVDVSPANPNASFVADYHTIMF